MALKFESYSQLADFIGSTEKRFCKVCQEQAYHILSGYKDYHHRHDCLKCRLKKL
ncbi:hypothetical protein HYS31_04305 [Candidatus Woesearchaeota archaeon]|nr:hypothetical protein [Candidatus Woesearchaeota archaeon]